MTTQRNNRWRLFGYVTMALLTLLLPVGTSAQFIPINQAKQQVQAQEQSDLTDVLTQINTKGVSAKSQITAIFTAQTAGTYTTDSASSQAELVTEKLKADYNTLLNDYTKKTPSGTDLRTAYNAAQQMIDQTRQQTSEALDQAELAKRQNPNQLSGKYLQYQQQIKAITDKALQDADTRLSQPGSRDVVTADLQKISSTTNDQVEISTNSFLSVNVTVLPSAIQRIKTQVLNDFSTAMASRQKQAAGLSNNKIQDLTADEQSDMAAQVKQMDDIVNRAVQTADTATQQIANSNLPTTSTIPGVNPLLEAKYKAEKQIQQVLDATTQRLDTMNSRYQARTDVSQNAKTIFSTEVTQEKNKAHDAIGEYLTYFSAGDPSKQKYNQAKQKAQQEAQGCTDFFCDLGTAIAGAAQGVIKATTGVNIGPAGSQFIKNDLFGISNPNPYARSQYQGTSGYTLLPGGVSATNHMQYNPGQCLASNNASTSGLDTIKMVFVERAYASATDTSVVDPLGVLSGGQDTSNPDRAFSDPAPADPENIGPEVPYNPPAQGGNGGAGGGATTPGGAKASPKPSTPWYQAAITGATSFLGFNAAQNAINQGLYACSRYPNPSYSSPFAGTGVPNLLGYNTSNLYPNIPSNWQNTMQTGFQIAAQQNPAYGQVLPYFNNGNGMTVGQYNQMSQYLGQQGFFGMPADNSYWYSPITNIFRNLCSPVFLSNPAMVPYCQSLWQAVNGSGIGGVGGIGSTAGGTTPAIGGGSSAYQSIKVIAQRLQQLTQSTDAFYGAQQATTCQSIQASLSSLSRAQSLLTDQTEQNNANAIATFYSDKYTVFCSGI